MCITFEGSIRCKGLTEEDAQHGQCNPWVYPWTTFPPNILPHFSSHQHCQRTSLHIHKHKGETHSTVHGCDMQLLLLVKLAICAVQFISAGSCRLESETPRSCSQDRRHSDCWWDQHSVETCSPFLEMNLVHYASLKYELGGSDASASCDKNRTQHLCPLPRTPLPPCSVRTSVTSNYRTKMWFACNQTCNSV